MILIAFVTKWSEGKGQMDSITLQYERTYSDIKEVLDIGVSFSFKQMCFLTENTYFLNRLDYEKFNETIKNLKNLIIAWIQSNPLKDYRFSDSINFHKNWAIYKVLKDTTNIVVYDSLRYSFLPYTYDFNDLSGKVEWSNMFVSKLLATKKGNCHSLPYLYKILADELGAVCWLGFAPNHIYIKNRCKGHGWYNTELTSGTFPIDAWITASGYIPLQAIQNGIYMDTLSNRQAIALCILDLAKGYEFQTHNYYDGFILKCCDLVLQCHPVNVQAMLLKAETLKRIYEKHRTENVAEAPATYKTMENLYIKLFELGYREMPESMYIDWLRSVTREKKKYQNDKLRLLVKPTTVKK